MIPKRNFYFIIPLLASSYFLVSAQIVFAQTKNIQWYLGAITGFINNTLIPFFFALAILFLFVNITRYFVIDGADANSREQARSYIMYAIIALVFLSSLWGIINLVIGGLGISDQSPICPDYINNGGCSGGGGSGGGGSNFDNSPFAPVTGQQST